ncbi:DUF4422 domain-containing protein [Methanomethylophilus alvi]|uniref:DUF4422 domain-containing protein n=1 Tax=Methanomethylophilus alvi TaxID=1291540 RepID=UPI0037DC03D1
MVNVKIYVSHRIDQDNEVVKNEVFVPVRCGAQYDEHTSPEMQGDDSGDNISEYRMNLGELTVQYWAWKNTDSDYYGLCHYRRYLSFSDYQFPVDEKNQVIENRLDNQTIEKYGLNDVEKITRVVSNYDIVVPPYADISKMYTPNGPQPSVYQHFCAYDHFLVNKEDLDNLIIVITRLYPHLCKSMHEYLSGKKFLGYNCYIMKKELFRELCEIEYNVITELKKSNCIDLKNRTSIQQRTYGFICEWIFGIFVYHLEKMNYSICRKQLVFFNNCSTYKDECADSDTIPLVFSTNRYLLPFTQTALISALENKSEYTDYCAIVFHSELNGSEILETKNFFLNKYQCTVKFININDIRLESDTIFDEKSVVVLLPWILEKHDKVIYLHSDVIINEDLSKLYCESYFPIISAPIDPILNGQCMKNRSFNDELRTKLGISAEQPIYSTNMMILNLEKMRFGYYELIKEGLIKKYSPKEIINSVFGKEIFMLSARWNECISMNRDTEILLEYLPKMYSDQLDHHGIFHYVGYPKPCNRPFDIKTAAFWSYARQSPGYESLVVHAVMSNIPSNPPVEDKQKTPLKYKLCPVGSVRYEMALKIINLLRR